jgi:hypothetical protein
MVVAKGDVEDMVRMMKNALASSESQMITVEAVAMAPEVLKLSAGQDAVGPKPEGKRPEIGDPGDERRPFHVKVVVKNTMIGKRSRKRPSKGYGDGERSDGQAVGRSGGDEPMKDANCREKEGKREGSTVHGSTVHGSAVGNADGRGKPVSRGPVPVAAPVAVGKKQQDGALRTVCDWNEVVLKGETISLRNREKVKGLLRFLEAGGATCRSKAITVGTQYGKPSSLFMPGGRYVRNGAGPGGREVAVASQLGVLIQRVYREGVGKVPPVKKSTGSTLYYLRVYKDSDVT